MSQRLFDATLYISTLEDLSIDFNLIRLHDLLNCSTDITETDIDPSFLNQPKNPPRRLRIILSGS